MVIWVLAVGYFFRGSMTTLKRCDDGATEYIARPAYAVLLFSLPLLFIALRSEYVDTGSYISSFNRAPESMKELDQFVGVRDHSELFYGSIIPFKMFVSDDPQVWLACIALLQGFFVMYTLRKYSCDLLFSTYLLATSAIIPMWFCNGMRQFIAVTILFACTKWMLENKWYFYLPLAVLLMGLTPITSRLGMERAPWYLCGIHQSVLVMIPAYFFLPGKAFNKRVWVLVGIVLFLVFTGGIDDALDSSVENTAYVKDLKYVGEDTGTSWFRVVFTALPLIMAVIARKDLKKADVPPIIHLCVNASVVTTVLYVASAFTSGMFVGRLPIYTEIYSLILIPWLLKHPFRKFSSWLPFAVMALFAAFLYYQLNISWSYVVYQSEVLGINVN
jgi:hypothetical protein